jgi:hypothetical protein
MLTNHNSNLLQNAVLLPAIDTLRTGSKVAKYFRETAVGSQAEAGIAQGSTVKVYVQPNMVGETLTNINASLTDTAFAFDTLNVTLDYAHAKKFTAALTQTEGAVETGINLASSMLQSAVKSAILAYDLEHVTNLRTASGLNTVTRAGAAITYANTVEAIRTVFTSKGIGREVKIIAMCAPSAFRAVNALPEVRNTQNNTSQLQEAGVLYLPDVNIEFVEVADYAEPAGANDADITFFAEGHVVAPVRVPTVNNPTKQRIISAGNFSMLLTQDSTDVGISETPTVKVGMYSGFLVLKSESSLYAHANNYLAGHVILGTA